MIGPSQSGSSAFLVVRAVCEGLLQKIRLLELREGRIE